MQRHRSSPPFYPSSLFYLRAKPSPPPRCAGISSLVAAIPLLQVHFDLSSRNVALLPVTLYTVGFSFGPCIASPISELYGRRCIYWTNLPLLIIFNAIAAASNNFAVLVTFRFLAGLGGSSVLAVAAGSLSDIWDTRQAGRVGVPYILAPFLGPTLGPLIGAYALHQYDNDWRWSIWVILLILAPVALTLPFMKETSKTRILYLRHKRQGRGVADITSSPRTNMILKGLLRPFHMAVFEVRCSPTFVYGERWKRTNLILPAALTSPWALHGLQFRHDLFILWFLSIHLLDYLPLRCQTNWSRVYSRHYW